MKRKSILFSICLCMLITLSGCNNIFSSKHEAPKGIRESIYLSSLKFLGDIESAYNNKYFIPYNTISNYVDFVGNYIKQDNRELSSNELEMMIKTLDAYINSTDVWFYKKTGYACKYDESLKIAKEKLGLKPTENCYKVYESIVQDKVTENTNKEPYKTTIDYLDSDSHQSEDIKKATEIISEIDTVKKFQSWLKNILNGQVKNEN